MAEGINVRLPGRLQEFVNAKSDPERGCFSSASEYIRDLIRRDYELEEQRKWDALKSEILPGFQADPSEFVSLSAPDIIASAKKRRKGKRGA